tara:strand:- start:10 stop:165 length:156 start_codon:yes stop_codon:yes gene_type:complete
MSVSLSDDGGSESVCVNRCADLTRKETRLRREGGLGGGGLGGGGLSGGGGI